MNKKRIIVLISIIIGICIVAALAVIILNSSSIRVKRQLLLGEKYLDELKYDDALLAFENAIKIDPINEEAYEGLINAYIGKQDYEGAADAYHRGVDSIGETPRLIKSGQRIAEHYMIQGTRYLSGDDYGKAADEYLKALDVKNDLEEAYIGYANACIGLKEYDKGLKKVEEGISIIGETDKLKKMKNRLEKLLGETEERENADREVEEEDTEETEETDTPELADEAEEAGGPRKIFDDFVSGKIKANIFGEDKSYSDLTTYGEIEETEYKDVDNDGEEEFLIYSYTQFYPVLALDIENGIIKDLCSGNGTAEMLSFHDVEGVTLACFSDAGHVGRQYYSFVQYKGPNIVDEFELSAEYWESEENEYDENSDFTFRGQKITMQEFEKLRKKYTGY